MYWRLETEIEILIMVLQYNQESFGVKFWKLS